MVKMFRLSAVLLMMLGLGCMEFDYIVGECANGIRSFLGVEAVLVKHLESYLDKLEIEQNTISSYLDDIDDLHEQIIPEEYFGNPINAFLAINRFVKIWKHEILDVLLTNNTYNEYINAIASEVDKKNLNGPTTVDLLNATDKLLFMQESEDIPTSELANEVLLTDMHSGKNVTLSSSECYAIGRNLNQLEHYEYAAQWLLQARKRSSLDRSRFPDVSKARILEQLAVAYKKLDNIKLAYKLNNEILKLEKTNKAALNNKIVLQKELELERIRMSKVTVEE